MFLLVARSSSELPRGPNDIYKARRSARQDNAVNAAGIEINDCSRKAEDSGPTNNIKLDNVWTLLERAKREEEESKDSVFICKRVLNTSCSFCFPVK